MKCKKCGKVISDVVAAETIEKIKAVCQALKVRPSDIESIAETQGPLCRKCMQTWGIGEDEPQP
jgi:hypothetical protein